jgi:hypothetical protein
MHDPGQKATSKSSLLKPGAALESVVSLLHLRSTIHHNSLGAGTYEKYCNSPAKMPGMLLLSSCRQGPCESRCRQLHACFVPPVTSSSNLKSGFESFLSGVSIPFFNYIVAPFDVLIVSAHLLRWSRAALAIRWSSCELGFNGSRPGGRTG